MSERNTGVSLEMVRAAAVALSEVHACPIEHITSKNVREYLGKGSEGYISAHLMEVKYQASLAAQYDRSDISPALKAAIFDECKRLENIAIERERKKAGVTKEALQEIRTALIEKEERIVELEQQFETLRQEAKEAAQKHERELSNAQAKASELEGANQILNSNLREAQSAHVDLAALKANFSHLQTEVEEVKRKAERYQQERDAAEKKYQDEHSRAELASQSEKHHKEWIEEKKEELKNALKEKKDLEERLWTVQEALPRMNRKSLQDRNVPADPKKGISGKAADAKPLSTGDGH